jgi:ERCC4-type nuclease
MATHYIFDDREDAIHQAFVTECAVRSPSPYTTRRERLVLGDVVIQCDGAVWATVERKRHDDLVNSFFALGKP